MKKLEIAILVLSLLAVAFVCGCDESPAEANEATIIRVSDNLGQNIAVVVEPNDTVGDFLNSYYDALEKSDPGIFARLAEHNKQRRAEIAEHKTQAYEAAIEREAEIQARAALKLIELMKDKEQ